MRLRNVDCLLGLSTGLWVKVGVDLEVAGVDTFSVSLLLGYLLPEVLV